MLTSLARICLHLSFVVSCTLAVAQPYAPEDGLDEYVTATGGRVFAKDNTSAKGECVWFARAVSPDGKRFSTVATSEYPVNEAALNILYNAKSAGLKTGTQPRVGALAVYDQFGKNIWGHVAVVTKVYPNGNVDLWDSNFGLGWTDRNGKYHPDHQVRVELNKDPEKVRKGKLLGYVYCTDIAEMFPNRKSEQAFVFVIDRSGSMSDMIAGENRSKLDAAKASINSFITVLETEGKANGFPATVGGVFFESYLEEVPPATTYRDLIAKVDVISATGGTALGEGLRHAISLFPGDATQRSIILLSDGLSNQGVNPSDVISELMQANIKVYATAFGDDADISLLQQIATQTGGAMGEAGTLFELRSSFLSARHDVIAQPLFAVSGTIAAPGRHALGTFDPTPQSIARSMLGSAFAQVMPGEEALLATFHFGDGQMDLELVDPAGKLVDSNYADATITTGNPTVIVVKNPLGGKWTATANATAVPDEGSEYELMVSGRSAQPTSAFGGGSDDDNSLLVGLIVTLGLFSIVAGGRIVWLRNQANTSAPTTAIGLTIDGQGAKVQMPATITIATSGRAQIGGHGRPWALLFTHNGQIHIRALDQDGVRVDGRRVALGRVSPGTQISIGDSTILVRS